ncbi:hypothetical protein B0920_23255 [Massilia sp. KIM]|uniref:hypothetical protein n=1 Tax=Massilia sp. KIM TaxID=1955422 RepID=UPI00098EBDDC|nr:hypothetical protein [Massilia sp. KIM]OON59314.1 hypothetical protein B0920_23255 [Massilia sp. KIM]
MQEPRKRVPSPVANLLIAALLAVPGALNLIGGFRYGSIGAILSGIAPIVYAVLLVRDAIHVKKTGMPAMPQKRMLQAGFACMAVYLVGIAIK